MVSQAQHAPGVNAAKRLDRALVCPYCRKGIVRQGEDLICVGCARRYPVVNGVPIFLDEGDRRFITEKQIKRRPRFSLAEWARGRPLLARTIRLLYPPHPTRYQPIVWKTIAALLERAGPESLVLDIGPSPGRRLGANVVNYDIDTYTNIDVVGDAHRMPFADESVDGVVIQAVLEHVEAPSVVLDEIYRVLRPGGFVYVEIPFMYKYHPSPADYQRYTLPGLIRLCRRFRHRESGMAMGPSSMFSLMLNEYLSMLLSFQNEYLQRGLRIVLGWATFPVKYLDDLWVIRHPTAAHLAASNFFVGEKGTGSE